MNLTPVDLTLGAEWWVVSQSASVYQSLLATHPVSPAVLQSTLVSLHPVVLTLSAM